MKLHYYPFKDDIRNALTVTEADLPKFSKRCLIYSLLENGTDDSHETVFYCKEEEPCDSDLLKITSLEFIQRMFLSPLDFDLCWEEPKRQIDTQWAFMIMDRIGLKVPDNNLNHGFTPKTHPMTLAIFHEKYVAQHQTDEQNDNFWNWLLTKKDDGMAGSEIIGEFIRPYLMLPWNFVLIQKNRYLVLDHLLLDSVRISNAEKGIKLRLIKLLKASPIDQNRINQISSYIYPHMHLLILNWSHFEGS